MTLGEGGKVTIAAGDLWVAPANKAVFEYTITLNMEKASLQGSKPITGQVRAAYQLVETGAQYNISIPQRLLTIGGDRRRLRGCTATVVQ